MAKWSEKQNAAAVDLLRNCGRNGVHTPPSEETGAQRVAKIIDDMVVGKEGVKQERTTYAESALQARCVAWFEKEYPTRVGTLFHVPNEGKKNVRSGARWKALGGVAGVADLILLTLGKCVFFELKSPKGYLSEKQKQWRELVRSLGYPYYVIRNFEDFQDVANQYVKYDGCDNQDKKKLAFPNASKAYTNGAAAPLILNDDVQK